MIFAIFGDVEGNLEIMFKLCTDYQQKNNTEIDLVLQVGDMGLWTSLDRLDTKKQKSYQKVNTQFITDYLNADRRPPVETWFIHGNNENFELLYKNQNKYVDEGKKLFFVAPGKVKKFQKYSKAVTIAGLGGMEYRFGKHPLPSDDLVQKYLHPDALHQLANRKQRPDILLMHDAPLNKGLKNKFPTGSKRITELIEKLQPHFLFYGHYDNPPKPFKIKSTNCVGMNFKVSDKKQNHQPAMGILNTDNWHFEFV